MLLRGKRERAMDILRGILGIVIGLVAGLVLVFAGDYLNHVFFPPPPDVQITNPEAVRRWMAEAPLLTLLGLPVTWTIAALAAAFAAAKIAGRAWAGWVAGGLIFAATCFNLLLIPHPLWMLIAAAVFVPLAAWLGGKFGGPARAAA